MIVTSADAKNFINPNISTVIGIRTYLYTSYGISASSCVVMSQVFENFRTWVIMKTHFLSYSSSHTHRLAWLNLSIPHAITSFPPDTSHHFYLPALSLTPSLSPLITCIFHLSHFLSRPLPASFLAPVLIWLTINNATCWAAAFITLMWQWIGEQKGHWGRLMQARQVEALALKAMPGTHWLMHSLVRPEGEKLEQWGQG